MSEINICWKCKEHIKGRYRIIYGNKYHQECYKEEMKRC